MVHRSILLVDDDEDDQFFFADMLQEMAPEIKCVIAENGLEALHILKKADPCPSLIFLDLNMPLMNGFECLIEIKKQALCRDIPLIIYSTSSDPGTIQELRRCGADAFFRKPSDPLLLRTKLKYLLDIDFSMGLQTPLFAGSGFTI